MPGGNKINNQRANLRTAQDVIGADGIVQQRKRFERCGECEYFERPNNCKIVEGPVAEDQVCDWIQGRTGDPKKDEPKTYNVPEGDWRAFAWGMMKRQPYQHRVVDFEDTAVGPLILIEDTADPPHRFSLDGSFHREHTSLEHHWTQQEVDALVREGREMDFKPPVSYEEASELYGRGELSREEFEPFRRAEVARKRAAK